MAFTLAEKLQRVGMPTEQARLLSTSTTPNAPLAGQTAVTATATTGTLPTANGAVTIANAATPTVAELLEYCTELNAKIAAIQGALD